jgi:hypothetical protein
MIYINSPYERLFREITGARKGHRIVNGDEDRVKILVGHLCDKITNVIHTNTTLMTIKVSYSHPSDCIDLPYPKLSERDHHFPAGAVLLIIISNKLKETII